MLVVSGHLQFTDRSNRDRIVAAGAPLQAATRAWPGCLAYCFSPDPVDERRIQIYEAWRDASALREHFTHTDYKEMRALLNSGGRATDQSDGYPMIHLVEQSSSIYDENRQPKTEYFGA